MDIAGVVFRPTHLLLDVPWIENSRYGEKKIDLTWHKLGGQTEKMRNREGNRSMAGRVPLQSIILIYSIL